MLCITAALTSCSNNVTLQTYFVDNELQPGFSTFDIPSSFINLEAVEMTDEQKDAYESVDKLNVLIFMKDSANIEKYKSELAKVNLILKDKKYEELMRGGNSREGKFMVKFLGDVESIDELIILGSANDKGFAVARVLGDDMNAAQLISLQSLLDNENTKFNSTQLEGLKDFFQ